MTGRSVKDDSERLRLEREREFLLRSLDDLERERDKGAIDDESYTRLHDDYTARAAAVIRALRDEGDSDEADDAAAVAAPPTSTRRRVITAIAIVLFLAIVGGAVAAFVGTRGDGETSSGNSGAAAETNRGGVTVEQRRKRLERVVAANPDDLASRLLLARYLEAEGDLAAALEQYDEVLARNPQSAEAQAQAGRILYLTAQAAVENDPDVVDGLVQQSLTRLDRAVEIDPEYPDVRFFRAIVVAYEYGDFVKAQGDLQRYLVLAPEGQFAGQARDMLAQVTSAIDGTPLPTTATSNPQRSGAAGTNSDK